MHVRSVLAVVSAAAFITGCAKAVDQIDASYVSPLQYDQYTCDQLAAEAVRVSENAARVMGGDKEGQIAVSKGKVEAMKAASLTKACT